MENQVKELSYIDHSTKIKSVLKGDYFFSSMPVKDLIKAMGDKVPSRCKN